MTPEHIIIAGDRDAKPRPVLSRKWNPNAYKGRGAVVLCGPGFCVHEDDTIPAKQEPRT